MSLKKDEILVESSKTNSLKQQEFNNYKFLKLIENSFEAIILLDVDFRISFISNSAKDIIGYETIEILSKKLLSFVHGEDVLPLKDKLENIRQKAKHCSKSVFRIKHQHGNYIWLESAISNLLDDHEIAAFVCNFRNITPQKNADELLQQTQNELFAYKYALNESSILAVTDEKGTIKHVNENFCRITGLSENQLLENGYRIINSGHQDGGDIEKIWTTISSGKIWKGELKNSAKNGNFYWVDTTIVPFLNDFGKPYQYVAISTDITERKLAELKIIENEQFVKTITDNVPAMISYWDADLNCLFANKPYADWFNKEPFSMPGINKRDLLDKDEFDDNLIYIEKVLNGEPQRFERSFRNMGDSTIYLSTQYLPDIQNDEIKGFYSLTYNYTDLLLAKAELKKQTEQVENLLENISDGFIGLDENLNYTYANKRVGEMLNVDPKTLIGKNIWELFPDVIGSATYRAITTALAEKKQVINEDYYEPLNLWQENRVYPAAKGVSMFIRDITEKKELEELLDKASNLAHIGSWEVDFVQNKIYWSKITKEIYEVLPSFEPDFSTDINFYPEGENRDKIVNAINQTIKTGEIFDVELQILSAKGNKKWVRAIGEAEFKDAQCVRVYGSIQDIDQRKTAEFAGIQALEERNIILESIDDAFFAVDNNWMVTYWNKRAEKMLKKPQNEMINKNLWDIFSDRLESEAFVKYHHAKNHKEVVHFEHYTSFESKWLEISAYPSDTGLSVYFKDISARKESDLQLQQLNESLQKHAKELATSNAELEQFAYVASHDLQEPLRMITSFLSQLERKYAEVLDEKGRQYIHFAVDGAKRMRQIILDLLEFSKVGQMEDDIEAVNINKLINEILILYRKQTEELNAEIVFKNLPTILTYKTPLRQVFQNLIGNGLKYQQPGRPPLIRIEYKETDSHHLFSVQDNGIGIESNFFDKIFIIFQRLHNKDEYGGSGMGLAIAKKIIENLGGKIWLESTEGTGSIFYFTLLKINQS